MLCDGSHADMFRSYACPMIVYSDSVLLICLTVPECVLDVLEQEEEKVTKRLPKPELTKEQAHLQSLRDAFDLFDVDGSGDIDRSEFKNLMKVRRRARPRIALAEVVVMIVTRLLRVLL
jgi:hypothetical protein